MIFFSIFSSLNSQLTKMASTKSDNRVTVVLGSQWGDEGKGIEILLSFAMIWKIKTNY